MELQIHQHYYVYITTNEERSMLYISLTSDLSTRLRQHKNDCMEKDPYLDDPGCCTNLVYWELIHDMHQALKRETQISSWTRKKKETTIGRFNPGWRALNEEIESLEHLYQTNNNSLPQRLNEPDK